MKLLTALSVAALLFGANSYAQTTSGSSTGGTAIGTMTVVVAVPSTPSGGTELEASKPTKGTRVTNEVLVMRTSSGEIQYKMNSSGIRVYDSAGTIDGVGTAEVYNLLASEAVRQGVAIGYTPPSNACGEIVQAKVWSEYYVNRMGSGSETRFYPYNTEVLCSRNYTACMEGSTYSADVDMVSMTTTSSSTTQNTMQ